MRNASTRPAVGAYRRAYMVGTIAVFALFLSACSLGRSAAPAATDDVVVAPTAVAEDNGNAVDATTPNTETPASATCLELYEGFQSVMGSVNGSPATLRGLEGQLTALGRQLPPALADSIQTLASSYGDYGQAAATYEDVSTALADPAVRSKLDELSGNDASAARAALNAFFGDNCNL